MTFYYYANLLNALNNAILYANHKIYSHVEKNSHMKGMSTTIAIILHKDEKLYYSYAGDSRIYIQRNNKLQVLTKDHTTVQQLIDKGEITPEQAKTHEKKDEVHNLLGIKKDFKFSTCKNPVTIVDNDCIIIATDGLSDQVDEVQIQEIIADEDSSVQHKALQLIEKANKAGGKDSVGLHIVRFFKQVHPQQKQEKKLITKPKGKRKIPQIVPYALIVIVVAIVGYYTYDLFFSNKSNSIAQPQTEKTIIRKKQEVKDVTDSIDNNIQDELTSEVVETVEEVVTEKIEEKPVEVAKDMIIEHQLKAGENFYRLGIRFSVTVQELEKVNNIEATKLQANQTVKIPIKAIHTVKSGEVLSSIAEKYNCKLGKIKRANKLENENLSLGQKLYIPKEYN